MMTRPTPAMIAFLLPCLAMPLALLGGSMIAMHRPAPAPVAPVFEPVAVTYIPFAQPIIVSLPQGGHINLTLGVAIDRRRGMAALAELVGREDQVPAIVTATLLATADAVPLADLRTAMPAALRESFNAALTKAGQPAMVTEVFLTSWTHLN
jgi:hypothetical protein